MLNPVQMYECEFCKKHFKTPNRHICKFDPKFKNCHSCKHCRGWKYEDTEIDTFNGTHEEKVLWPVCVKDIPDTFEYTALSISYSYILNCFDYEWCGGRWVDYCNDNDIKWGTEEENVLDLF